MRPIRHLAMASVVVVFAGCSSPHQTGDHDAGWVATSATEAVYVSWSEVGGQLTGTVQVGMLPRDLPRPLRSRFGPHSIPAMYNPGPFQETDRIVLRDMVRELGVAELITFGTAGIEASIVPVLIDDDVTCLTAHLARANRQWRNADVTVPALVTFRGPDAYVSPGYYPSKQEHGKVVPTWNYITVQARGHLTIHDDPNWTRALVDRLTRHHEQRFEKPWSTDDAPADFIDGLVNTIVGVEINLSSIEGKWKLSQNRPEADRAGVRTGLQRPGASQNEIQTAAFMPLIPR